jgi:hypothetical protein
MTFTKKFTRTYTNGAPLPGDADSPFEVLEPLRKQLVAEGKTDGVLYKIDDKSSYRLFVDQASAQSWADLCKSTGAQNGRNDLSCTITDI